MVAAAKKVKLDLIPLGPHPQTALDRLAKMTGTKMTGIVPHVCHITWQTTVEIRDTRDGDQMEVSVITNRNVIFHEEHDTGPQHLAQGRRATWVLARAARALSVLQLCSCPAG